jgi:alanine dehydrogenase
MTLLLSDADVRAVLSWRPAVDALRAAYATAGDGTAGPGPADRGPADHGAARYPGRLIARGDATWLRVLPGVPGNGGLMGAKIIAAAPGAGRVSYLIALFDQATTQLVALIDGNTVTGYRTAATSALAADLLAIPGPLTVGVLGSGFEASKHLQAIASIRDITAARVYSPRTASRERFARDFADQRIPVSPVPSAEAAVADAALVICATRSHDQSPVLLGRWLAPGMTVVSVGSTAPEQHEVDAETIARADVIVADVVHEVLRETGDLIAARSAGTGVAGRVASLADLVSGVLAGRADDGQIVLYKSVGSAVQDLAVAAMCVRAALEGGLGTQAAIPVEVVLK